MTLQEVITELEQRLDIAQTLDRKASEEERILESCRQEGKVVAFEECIELLKQVKDKQ